MKNRSRKSFLSKAYDAITPSMSPMTTTTTKVNMGNTSSENRSLISSLTTLTSPPPCITIINNADGRLIFDIFMQITFPAKCIWLYYIYPFSFFLSYARSITLTLTHISVALLQWMLLSHSRINSFSSKSHEKSLSAPLFSCFMHLCNLSKVNFIQIQHWYTFSL